MSKSRKTIEVDSVRTMANHFLANSPQEAAFQRQGTIGLVETILSQTGNYRGFRYLEAIHSDGKLITLGDETRRYYN